MGLTQVLLLGNPTRVKKNKNNMETLTQLETLVTSIKVDAEKFFDKKNKSAGIRARKSAQELKAVLQSLRKEILEESKK